MKKNTTPGNKRKKKIIRRIIWISIIVIIVLVGGYFLRQALSNNNADKATLTKTTATVQRGDVSKTLGNSASLNSANISDHISEVSGEVLAINYEDGDYVEAGQVVIILDSEVTDETIQIYNDQINSKLEQIDNLNDAIEDTHASIDDHKDNITDANGNISELRDDIASLEAEIIENESLKEDLNIYAPFDGIVFNLQVSEGDYVGTGTLIATLTNPLLYEVEMPFSVDFLNHEVEEVLIHYKNSNLTGEIVSYADFTHTDAYGNELVDVVIAFTRFAALPDDARVKGTISTDFIPYKCVTEIAPYYAQSENIFPLIQGELLSLNLTEKQSVETGDLIAVIDGESIDSVTESLESQIESKNDQVSSLNDSIENYNESIVQLNENIEDYLDEITSLHDDIAEIEADIAEAEEGYISSEITAEFNGIVTGFTIEEGDSVGNSQKLFTLISMDNPEMSLTIDELDITEVTVGLEAEVVIDALPDTQDNPVDAIVTDISLTGNTQGGVTTYTVTIALLENPEDFKLGMNATATIFTSKSQDTLFIPIEAVTFVNGNSFVWVTDTAVGAKAEYDKSAYAGNSKGIGDAAGKRPGVAVQKDTSKMTEEQKERYEEYLKNADKTSADSKEAVSDNAFATVEDYYAGATRIPVTTGIHNESYIEILNGLTEGQIVVLPPVYISESDETSFGQGDFNMGTARKAIGGIGGGGK